MTDIPIYKADTCESLNSKLESLCNYSVPHCNETAFLSVMPQAGRSLAHALPDKSAASLHRFTVTSTLDYPSPFNRDTFANLTKQRSFLSPGIPFVALFLEEYIDAQLDDWLQEVNTAN